MDDLFFRDCFTEIDEGVINEEINKLTVKCISSTNNNFSLDCDGNLVVNTITTNNDSNSGNNVDLNMVYPVGSIYMSTTNVDPSTLFGGTWNKIQDRFLLGSGNTYMLGSTGGSAELQAHTHSIPQLTGSTNNTGAHSHKFGTDKDAVYNKSGSDYSCHNNSISGAQYQFTTSTDGGHAHSVTTNASTSGTSGSGNGGNMPPYLTVNIWERVA